MTTIQKLPESTIITLQEWVVKVSQNRSHLSTYLKNNNTVTPNKIPIAITLTIETRGKSHDNMTNSRGDVTTTTDHMPNAVETPSEQKTNHTDNNLSNIELNIIHDQPQNQYVDADPEDQHEMMDNEAENEYVTINHRNGCSKNKCRP